MRCCSNPWGPLALALALGGCGGSPAVLPDADDAYEAPLIGACEPADAIELVDFQQRGRTLWLEVRHGGGCERHTYMACLEEPHPDTPRAWSLRIRHDAHGDLCRAEITRMLRIALDRDLEAQRLVGGALELR